MAWSRSYIPIHLLVITSLLFITLLIGIFAYSSIIHSLSLCRHYCEVYPSGCVYYGWLGCKFRYSSDSTFIYYEATYEGLVIFMIIMFSIIVIYSWISTIYVEVSEEGILIIKNLFLRRRIYILRDEIAHIYIQTPNPLGIWFRHGRSKAVIVHSEGVTAFALYSGDLVEFPQAVKEYLNITPEVVESALGVW